MIKFAIRLAMVWAVALIAGCASGSRSAPPLADEMAPRGLDARVVECTLPFLETHGLPGAAVRYRYDHGSTTFESENRMLSAHLAQCAATSNGPDITFEREIDVWSSTEK